MITSPTSSTSRNCGPPAAGHAGSASPQTPATPATGTRGSDVTAIKPESADALIEYYEAVAARTRQLLDRISASDLDRIVDDRWDPPVSMGVRLISIADDDIQHAAQASYARGMLDRR